MEGTAFAAAREIDRAVDGDPVEPGEELGLGLEFFECLVDAKKNFLRNIERVFPIAYKTEGDSVDPLPVFFEEEFKRGFIAGKEGFHLENVFVVGGVSQFLFPAIQGGLNWDDDGATSTGFMADLHLTVRGGINGSALAYQRAVDCSGAELGSHHL
tara:strand:+ start:896 stop:1363 length:468 start_codon:yes stop_codon:yes gene_type:complete